MSVNPPQYTYDDYRSWEGDWELIAGYPFAMAPSFYGKHQKVMMRLGALFHERLEECECEIYPELDWIVNEKTVVRPDLAVYCEDVEEYPKTTPKIVVEIVSKSTAEKDEEIKFGLYEAKGVEYYVLAYPEFGKVRIFKLEGGKYKKVYEGDGKFDFELCGMDVDFSRVFQ